MTQASADPVFGTLRPDGEPQDPFVPQERLRSFKDR